MGLRENGHQLMASGLGQPVLQKLRNEIFIAGEAGTRCLLDVQVVREVALDLCRGLIAENLLAPAAVAIQAIAFDKTPGSNWKVVWHQDLMFPLARPATASGYEVPVRKQGVDYARPPREVLEQLLAVRLHLDDCGPDNGPLRISPGTHRQGLLRHADIADQVRLHGEVVCQAKTGEILLMKPLLLHASSPATEPRHRRVLHLVYHSGAPVDEQWHRAVHR